MNLFQRYVFRQALWPFLGAMSALTGLAVLTQSLSNLDLIAEQGETAFAFFGITLLAMPQIIALLMPIALFLACSMTFNRLIGDSELTVGAAAGLSRRQRLAPFVRLGIYAVLANLIINLFIQPASFREMRELLYEIRNDLVAGFMREGQFIALGQGVTFYTRDIIDGSIMIDVFIEDRRDEHSVAYTAKRGIAAQSSRGPVLLLENGERIEHAPNGALSSLTFESSEFDLSTFVDSTAAFAFKDSDKYLPELLNPTSADIARSGSKDDLYAEGHYRLSAPLYNLAFVLIAASAFLAVQHRRTGYMKFMILAGVSALILRLVGFAVQAAATSDDALNPVQYLLPLFGIFIASYLIARPSLKEPLSRWYKARRAVT